MIEVKGKGNVSAKIIADSISAVNRKRITTLELEFHRYILPEFNTHRMFSRNAASSRAIPVEKMLELVRTNPAMPIHWGKNQPGMSAKEECDDHVELYAYHADRWVDEEDREDAWGLAAESASKIAAAFSEAGYHKQIVNRLLEPFQMIKVVCTATEYDNFFWLRNHPDAQPEIQELARCMWEALQKSEPEVLQPGEWHTPYVAHADSPADNTVIVPVIFDEVSGVEKYISWEDALKISASCCAQVSYRKADDSLEKAIAVYDRLVTSTPVHASPFEHQATPMSTPSASSRGGMMFPESGQTHMDSNTDYWSGNFKSWIQHRQLIPNNVCWKYEGE